MFLFRVDFDLVFGKNLTSVQNKFGSVWILVIYYLCNSWAVNLQQILQRYCYVERTVQPDFDTVVNKNLYAKRCFGRVLKRSLSAHWMQVKLVMSLLIWIADCTQFLSENHPNGCQIFGQFGSFKTDSETIFSSSHTPTLRDAYGHALYLHIHIMYISISTYW